MTKPNKSRDAGVMAFFAGMFAAMALPNIELASIIMTVCLAFVCVAIIAAKKEPAQRNAVVYRTASRNGRRAA